MMGMKFIIEHLEPELYEWCSIEYKHISRLVGANNLIITNIKNPSLLKGLGKIESCSAADLGLEKVCVLDPSGKHELSHVDAERFDYILLGGILGDDPPQKRTKKISVQGERMNLGKIQMATDNAAYVAKRIIEGAALKDIEFQDDIEIEIKDGESVQLPYRYVVINGKPLVCKDLIEHLKKEDTF